MQNTKILFSVIVGRVFKKRDVISISFLFFENPSGMRRKILDKPKRQKYGLCNRG